MRSRFLIFLAFALLLALFAFFWGSQVDRSKSTNLLDNRAALKTTPNPNTKPPPNPRNRERNLEKIPPILIAPRETRLVDDSFNDENLETIEPTPTPSPLNSQNPLAGTNQSDKDESESDPLTETLREIQRIEQPRRDNRIYGMRARTPSSSSNSRTPAPTPTATSTPTPPLLVGMTTGYTILALMQPEARLMVESQVEIMLRSNVKSLYLGVLADGTFTFSYPYLNDVIRRLSADGRRLTLVIYFANGSAMRQYDRTPIDAGFNFIEPEAFRYLISEDEEIRNSFRSIVSRSLPTFQLNRSLSAENTNYAVVMLEDNLDADSYRAMREVAKSVLGDAAQFIRNPCEGPCYGGGDTEPHGDLFESHSIEGLQNLRPRDGFSLDGISYRFLEEPPSPALSIEDVKAAKTIAIQRGAGFFGLWRAARQGLGNTLILPSERSYEVATLAQQDIEVELMRFGLNPEPTPKP